ncbi:MAG: DMT family transporter [Clostridia bacterium]|nr:DMT family transporter [Clostridia bacterium]MBQ6359064.1 DMT family transporter [Clostridia bacterium]MBQ9923026.1 DMT family transporter [Clostridia bacterium]MBR0422106.1 DMT family transporter [Clostridia bacterium]
MKQTRYSLILLGCSVIWGSAFVAQSAAMDLGMLPYAFTAVRMLVGAVCLMPFIYLRRRTALPATREGKARLLRSGMLIGVAVAVASCLQQAGLQYTTAGKGAFLTALYILLVPIVGAAFFHRKTGAWTWLCLVIGAVGLWFLSITEAFTLEKGDALMILCALVFTLQILLVDKFAPDFDPLTLCCLEFLTAGLLSFLPMAIFEGFGFQNIRPAIWCILYCGIFSCGIAYWLQIVGQRHLPPALASLIMSFESVFGAIFGALILHERMTGRELLGCGLIFAALVLSQVVPERKD